MVIFDSSVLIDQFSDRLLYRRIADLDDLVRTSAVVLAELWRGGTTQAEQAVLRALERRHPILTPTEQNWLESGSILGKVQRDYGFEGRKLRELHFDVLIALTLEATEPE